MKFEIMMKDDVYDEVSTLMSHIKDINEGQEIGAWLLGDWVFKNGIGKLLIDRFIIPKQEVTGVEVDISPESMIDTVKEIGYDQANRIKAHWHIHPFNKGKTDWSGTDEAKIRDFMVPEKKRKIFVFLLSSLDQIKARVEMNITGQLSDGVDVTISHSVDDLEVVKESQEQDSPILDKLKRRIEEKVQRRKIVTNAYDWKDRTSFGKNEDNFKVNRGKDGIYVSLDDGFALYVQKSIMTSEELKNPDSIKQKKDGKQTWMFKLMDKTKYQLIIDALEEELARLELEYWEEKYLPKEEQYNEGYGYSARYNSQWG